MRASTSISEIVGCTDFAGMGSSSPSPPPTTNGFHVNGYPSANHGSSNCTSSSSHSSKPTVLHLGDEICYNLDVDSRIKSKFNIRRPDPEDLTRDRFIQHLKQKKWGDFDAIMKPFWSSGSQMHPWNEELIQHLPKSMKVMTGAGAGFDWVDTKALADRGIVYCNGAHASTESVANTALFHLISVFTHTTWSTMAARSGAPRMFSEAHTEIPLQSHNPCGHKLGIVGLGSIGFAIAKKVHAALHMDILYTDLIQKSPTQEREASATFYPSMETMLPDCDALLLATPSGPPLITHLTLSLLPKGARVVNIARGTLVDEEALADALDSGHISAAGLDVHASEPNVNPRFRGMRNVQLTCHTGGASVETNRGFEKLAMENVEAVLERRKPLTAVNMHLMADTPLVNGQYSAETER